MPITNKLGQTVYKPGETIPETPVDTNEIVNTPTASDIYGDVNFETPEERDIRETIGEGYKTDALQTIDEDEIRQQTMDRFQAEIDALNKVYAEKKREAQTEGLGRLGSLGAVQARRGLLGSDFGTTQKTKQEQANLDVLNALEAERSAKESNIRNAALGLAQREYESKVAAKKQGAEAYLKYISESASRREANTKTIAKQLYESGTYETEDLEGIADSLGVSIEALKNTYNTYKKQADEAKRIAQQEEEEAKRKEIIEREQSLLKEGYSYIKTPATRDRLRDEGYDIIELGGRTYGKKPKLKTETRKIGSATYSITTDEKGNVKKKTLISGGGTVPSKDKEAITEMTGAMSQVIGGDGYISPTDWYTLRGQWVSQGLSPTTFDKNFKGYQNPKDFE